MIAIRKMLSHLAASTLEIGEDVSGGNRITSSLSNSIRTTKIKEMAHRSVTLARLTVPDFGKLAPWAVADHDMTDPLNAKLEAPD